MRNERLRHALQAASVTQEQLAAIIEVDARTVRRWITGSLPHPRQRARIARALNQDQAALFPQLSPVAAGEPAVVGGTITGYPTAADPDAPSTASLISAASERIELLDDTLQRLLTQPGVTEMLISKASQRCKIRILVAAPTPALTPLLDHPAIAIQAIEDRGSLTIHRADQQMLLSIHLQDLLGEPPILLHIQREQAAAVFDRIAEHYQNMWDDALEPINTATDIDHYLHEDDTDQWPEDSPEPGDEHDPAPSPTGPPRLRGAQTTPGPRRWPRRPPTAG